MSLAASENYLGLPVQKDLEEKLKGELEESEEEEKDGRGTYS